MPAVKFAKEAPASMEDALQQLIDSKLEHVNEPHDEKEELLEALRIALQEVKEGKTIRVR